jgi:hypothetical protein
MSEESTAINPNSMTIIVTKGSLDWAYPPFILSTAPTWSCPTSWPPYPASTRWPPR